MVLIKSLMGIEDKWEDFVEKILGLRVQHHEGGELER
jgi:hypothetical protein